MSQDVTIPAAKSHIRFPFDRFGRFELDRFKRSSVQSMHLPDEASLFSTATKFRQI